MDAAAADQQFKDTLLAAASHADAGNELTHLSSLSAYNLAATSLWSLLAVARPAGDVKPQQRKNRFDFTLDGFTQPLHGRNTGVAILQLPMPPLGAQTCLLVHFGTVMFTVIAASEQKFVHDRVKLAFTHAVRH